MCKYADVKMFYVARLKCYYHLPLRRTLQLLEFYSTFDDKN